MVRFIISEQVMFQTYTIDLHSNMVRFIIEKSYTKSKNRKAFTFQYG